VIWDSALRPQALGKPGMNVGVGGGGVDGGLAEGTGLTGAARKIGYCEKACIV